MRFTKSAWVIHKDSAKMTPFGSHSEARLTSRLREGNGLGVYAGGGLLNLLQVELLMLVTYTLQNLVLLYFPCRAVQVPSGPIHSIHS